MLKERVLLVDDEPLVLVALEDLLSSDFTILTAESGAKALRLIENEGDVAVILTDQRMPQMTGDQFLERLEGRTNAARILVTGFADMTAMTSALNRGRICAYVTKPWDADDLRLKVQAAAQQFRLAEELARERRLLHDLMDNISDGIYFKDAELRFVRANRPFCERLNSSPDEVVGKSLQEVVKFAAAAEQAEAEERGLLAGGAPIVDDVRLDPLGSPRRWFSESKAVVREHDGVIVGVVGISRDVSERKAQEARIERLTSVRALISGINAAIVRLRERDALLVECCKIAAVAGGLVLAVIATVDPKDQSVRIVATEPHGAPIIDELQAMIAGGPHRSELLVQLFKSPRPVVIADISRADFLRYQSLMLAHGLGSAAVIPIMRAGQIDSVFCLFSKERNFFDKDEMALLTEVVDDISFALDHIERTERLTFLAYHDSLTGLANRDKFVDFLDSRATLEEQRPWAVLVADVGRFRHINGTWGRQAGDALLMEIASRFKSIGPPIELVARLFGNTFALLVSLPAERAQIRAFVDAFVGPVFEQVFELSGSEIPVAGRVGIAAFPADGTRGEALLANAEAALQKAKATGQHYVFYEPAMNARIAEQMTLEAKLRRALEREEFLLQYQPKVELGTGAVVGLEALIRWRDASGGLVPPGLFIPLLEETGLIRDVGRWVLEHAAWQYRQWTDAGLRVPAVAVNVSALQLAAHDFVAQLAQTAERLPSQTGLELEITESVFVDDLEGSVAKLQAARALGFRVSMDDFGTGYSSLSSLGRLPLDTLKIDRSFVINMAEDPQSTSIVTTIISLAHALDLRVVAEGVETSEQATLLRLLKCNEAQGYLMAKPLPADAVRAVLGARFDWTKASFVAS